ncbi:site-specific integrase [Nibribacter koreensis]|uniref:Site-specific integrase n=1 Tax=Nibribacter koreensis TaxID=1084519 RepID=A0ABP8FBL9_9BACT
MAFTLKATLKPEPRADKTHAVRLRVTKDRRSSYYNPGVYVGKSHWNPKATYEKRNWVKGTLRTCEVLNNAIRNHIDGLEAHGLANPALTASELVQSYKEASEQPAPITAPSCFIAFLTREIQRGKEARNPRSLEKETATLAKFKAFAGETLPFSALTVALVRDYVTHLETVKNNRPTTVHNSIGMLRKYAAHAMAEGLLSYEQNPFHTVRVKKTARKKQRLDLETLERFRTVELEDPLLIHARHTFMASFYMHGARINDVLELRWTQVGDERIRYTMDKTDKEKDIKITPQLREILEFYRPKEGPLPTFVFPFLKEKHLERGTKEYLQIIEGCTDRINKRLKDIAALAKLEVNLSTHAARHTFADIARKKIRDAHTIKNLLNHSSIATTERYLSSFDRQDEDEATDSIYG